LVDTIGDHPSLCSFGFPLPGDEHVSMVSFFVASVGDGGVTPVDLPPQPVSLGTPLQLGYVRWTPDSARVEVVNRGRFFRDAQLVRIDPATGAAETLVDEHDAELVEPAEGWENRPCARALDGSRALWFSRRDGW